MSFIAPSLPRLSRYAAPSRIVCGRKPRRRPKNPSPVQTRPLPSLPPLPTQPPTPEESIPPIPRTSSKSLTKILQSRYDALVISSDPYNPIITALSHRETKEHALILLPTRTCVLHLSNLLSDPDRLPKNMRKTRVIIAAGKGLGSWKHAAMNANSSTYAVVVIGTPRAMYKGFFTGHGRPWLERVRFLAIGNVSEMLEIGCFKELRKVVDKIGVKRKTTVVDKIITDDIRKFVHDWLRAKHGVVQWGDDVPISRRELNVEGHVVAASPRDGVELLVKTVDERKEGERVVVLFPAARVLEVYATILRIMRRDVIDIHAKTSLGNRLRGLEAFKDGGVLLGTDTVLDEVGKVDLVVNMGVVDEGTYRRRVAIGKRGVVVVRSEVAELMTYIGDIERFERDETKDGIFEKSIGMEVGEKARRVGYQSLVTSYASWRRRLGWTRPQVIEFINEWAKELFGEVPEIERKFAGRKRLMKYKDVRVRQVAKEAVASR